MSLLTGVHGAAALLVLVVLLFAEEAGVPIPFAPGEVTLVATGLLVASGAVSPYLAIPLAFLACGSGAWVGFAWARRLGGAGLAGLAARLHAEAALERASRRLAESGSLTVAVSRSIPGLRIYTSLVAGAVGMPMRTFLAGALPAVAVWVAFWVLLGATVGIPAQRVFTDAERLLLRSVVLLVVAVLGFTAARRIPSVARSAQVAEGIGTAPLRATLAAAIDLGVVLSVVTGLGALARTVLGATTRLAWLELPVAALLVAVAYLLVARRGAGATAGESLLAVTYVRRRLVPATPDGRRSGGDGGRHAG